MKNKNNGEDVESVPVKWSFDMKKLDQYGEAVGVFLLSEENAAVMFSTEFCQLAPQIRLAAGRVFLSALNRHMVDAQADLEKESAE